MDKIRIGVLGPADIAMRRMVPAIKKITELQYVGVAVALPEERGKSSPGDMTFSQKKADRFVSEFGGRIFRGYKELLASSEIDAVYIALPPALHYTWARKALDCGKHVLLEKPFTVKEDEAKELIALAQSKNLAVTENFAFVYHNQLDIIREIIASGEIGKIRLIRSNFAFPFRGETDFRYKKESGGGALLDCGCYTLKLAQILLDDRIELSGCTLVSAEGLDVDLYGTISALGGGGEVVQLSFGMDQQYNCELEVWGSRGCIRSPRIYTAPPDYRVELQVRTGSEQRVILAKAEDQFQSGAEAFVEMIGSAPRREEAYKDILRQSDLQAQCMAGGVIVK